jgi:hypothetical protein
MIIPSEAASVGIIYARTAPDFAVFREECSKTVKNQDPVVKSDSRMQMAYLKGPFLHSSEQNGEPGGEPI